jgi:hypothetical protein
MSLVTANGASVISGSIVMPLKGVWTADLVIDQPDGTGFDAGTAVSIKAEDGFTLSGTVVPDRTGSFIDAVHVSVMGGAGGMGKTLKARTFAQPGAFVRDVLNALASDSGETLSSSIDQSFLSTNITAWATFEHTASQALATFLGFVLPTANWRFLADGTLWIGIESWQSASHEFDVLERDPLDGSATLGIVSPSILPGDAIADIGNVARVEHRLSSEGVRSHVLVDISAEERGERAAIAAIVRQETAGIDYLAFYDAVVKSQSADGTMVDITPNDTRLAGMSRVPLRHGLPGCAVQITPGATIRIGWDGGDPRKPFVALWNGGESITALTIGSAPTIANYVATKQDLQDLLAGFATMTPIANDGGLNLKATLLNYLGNIGWPVCSSVVKVQR